MSEPTYYLRSRGKVAGPFPLAKLQVLKDRGHLGRSHQLSTDQVSWTPAGNVAALYAPAAPPPPPSTPLSRPLAERRSVSAPPGVREPDARELDGWNPDARAPHAPAPIDADHDSPPAVVPPPESGAPLWYFRAGSGERVGPVSASDLRGRIAAGEVRTSTMVWREGMESWAAADTRQEFAGVLPSGPSAGGRYSGLAIASLPLGLVGATMWMLGWLLAEQVAPVAVWLMLLSFPVCLLGLIFGVFGVALAVSGDRRRGLGLAIAGGVSGLLGVCVWYVLWIFVGLAVALAERS